MKIDLRDLLTFQRNMNSWNFCLLLIILIPIILESVEAKTNILTFQFIEFIVTGFKLVKNGLSELKYFCLELNRKYLKM